MEIGDLVLFSPPAKFGGSLTAVKYFGRMQRQTNNLAGVVIEINGTNAVCTFGDKVLILNKAYLEVVS